MCGWQEARWKLGGMHLCYQFASISRLNLTIHDVLRFRHTVRILTSFLYAGKFGWGTLIDLHLLAQISGRYEAMGPICTRVIRSQQNQTTNQQNDNAQQQSAAAVRQPDRVEYYDRGEMPDYAFALLLGCVGILLSNFVLLPYLPSSITKNQQYVFFSRHLTFFVLYIWSKQHPNRDVNLFGVHMAAAYLPYAYLILGYAFNNGQVLPLDMLHGMFVGHVYYYLACVVPKVLPGRVVIVTPLLLVNFCYWMEGRRFGDGAMMYDNNPMVVDVDGVIGG